jgi:hypothetical protein
MKCTNCENTVFFKLKSELLDNRIQIKYGLNPHQKGIDLENLNGENVHVEYYMCEKCGHIDSYILGFNYLIKTYTLLTEKLNLTNKDLDLVKSKLTLIEKESSKFDNEILSLNEIMKNDNNSLKAIKEAEAKIPLAEREKKEFLKSSGFWVIQSNKQKLEEEIKNIQYSLENYLLSK